MAWLILNLFSKLDSDTRPVQMFCLLHGFYLIPLVIVLLHNCLMSIIHLEKVKSEPFSISLPPFSLYIYVEIQLNKSCSDLQLMKLDPTGSKLQIDNVTLTFYSRISLCVSVMIKIPGHSFI